MPRPSLTRNWHALTYNSDENIGAPPFKNLIYDTTANKVQFFNEGTSFSAEDVQAAILELYGLLYANAFAVEDVSESVKTTVIGMAISRDFSIEYINPSSGFANDDNKTYTLFFYRNQSWALGELAGGPVAALRVGSYENASPRDVRIEYYNQSTFTVESYVQLVDNGTIIYESFPIMQYEWKDNSDVLHSYSDLQWWMGSTTLTDKPDDLLFYSYANVQTLRDRIGDIFSLNVDIDENPDVLQSTEGRPSYNTIDAINRLHKRVFEFTGDNVYYVSVTD